MLEKVYRTKGVLVIKSRQSKDRQYNGQHNKKDKRINTDLQNTTQNSKDFAKSSKNRGSESVSRSCSTSGTMCIVLLLSDTNTILNRNQVSL
jgi:hypothetical protein